MHTPSQLIFSKKTRDKGRGVFAKCAIAEGELIEEVPVLVMRESELYAPSGTSLLGQYVFHWRPGYVALALGFGSLYNHSYTPNAFVQDVAPQTKRIVALRAIAAGEEITFNYAGAPDATADVGFPVQ